MKVLVGMIVSALTTLVSAESVTTNITVPSPTPGVPLQVWVDVNPSMTGAQRCTIDAWPADQLLQPQDLPPAFVDFTVDVRLINPIELFPAKRLHQLEFTMHFDPAVVAPAPGFMNAPAFFGGDGAPEWFVPKGAPPGTIRVIVNVSACPVGLPNGFLIYPGFNGLVARCGFMAMKDGQTGIDLSDIVFYTTSNSSCQPVTLTAGAETWARAQVIVNHDAAAIGCWTVNRTFDAPDLNPGDGVADSNPTLGIVDATLSACIAEANARTGPDTVSFAYAPIGAPIVVAADPSPIKDSSGPLLLDGFSQPMVEIRSVGAANGLTITSAGNIVRGLSLTGFGGAGVRLIGATSNANTLVGNRIGVNWLGGVVGNGLGVMMVEGATSNTLGGPDPLDSNLIRGNLSDGVLIQPGNLLTRNSIRGNAGLGVRATAPMTSVSISSAFIDGVLEVHGSLAGLPSTEHRIEVFNNLACDTSGFGEGASFLGDSLVSTNQAGLAEFAIVISMAPEAPTPTRLSLTASNEIAGTSEFSNCFKIDRIGSNCTGDIDGDGTVNGLDLALLLGTWSDEGPGDLDGNGVTDGIDLALLLGHWGACP